jgi:non-ribosomal peptide synthase protein (TIGR01720 family)
LHDDGDDIALELEYQAALYDPATMERWADDWLALVDALVADARLGVAALSPSGTGERMPASGADEVPGTDERAQAALAQTLAQLFADVLGPELVGSRTIGVDDSFFALGGDSILGLKLIARLREHGQALTPKDLFRAPTPAGLARLATPLVATGEQGELQGDVPLMPIQHWFLSQQQPHAAHWNQSVLADSRRPLQAVHVRGALQALVSHHDALRLRFRQVQGAWQASYAPADAAWRFVEVADVAELGDLAAGFDLAQGPLWAAALVQGTPQRLYVAAHHLVVDAVSWQLLLEDFQRLYEALERGGTPALPPKTASYRQWAEQVQALSAESELAHWQAQSATSAVPLQTVGQCSALRARWDADRTRRWLTEAHAAYRTRPDELLVAALAATLAGALAKPEVVIELERHGRDGAFDGLDASRTVGWFTTLFPVRIASRGDAGECIREAKASLRGVPGQGVGHGLLRQRGLLPAGGADVLFNHLGHEAGAQGWLQPSALAAPPDVDPRNRVTHAREVITWLQDGSLHVEWRTVHPEADAALPQALLDRLDALVDHCLAPQAGALMPQDFPLAKGLNQKTLDRLLKQLR